MGVVVVGECEEHPGDQLKRIDASGDRPSGPSTFESDGSLRRGEPLLTDTSMTQSLRVTQLLTLTTTVLAGRRVTK